MIEPVDVLETIVWQTVPVVVVDVNELAVFVYSEGREKEEET